MFRVSWQSRTGAQHFLFVRDVRQAILLCIDLDELGCKPSYQRVPDNDRMKNYRRRN